jgi:hypothetical protein
MKCQTCNKRMIKINEYDYLIAFFCLTCKRREIVDVWRSEKVLKGKAHKKTV